MRRRVVESAALAASVLLVLPLTAAAQQSIILVRHAERLTGSGDDPLSEAGRHRAERLAAMLKDAGVTHIFVSNRRGTLETAEPLARLHHLSATRMPIPAAPRGNVAPAELQVRSTIAALVRLPRTAVVLVVGHSDTIPILGGGVGGGVVGGGVVGGGAEGGVVEVEPTEPLVLYKPPPRRSAHMTPLESMASSFTR